MAFELPTLPYAYDALEPQIDEETMRLHHGKHHAGYTNKLNTAIAGTDWEGKSIIELLANISALPEALRSAVQNNGGGYANHSLFWETMGPGQGGSPSGELGKAIDSAFGGFEKFKEIFQASAATRFGSGWGWLVLDSSGSLKVYSTGNQDSPYMTGDIPLLGVDVWEHAYYKKYGPARADYLSNWWSIVNWNKVAEYYAAATK